MPLAFIGNMCTRSIYFYVALREDIKYYFADFVRKGGTTPPLGTNFSPKKITDLGGTPPHPFSDIPSKFFYKKD